MQPLNRILFTFLYLQDTFLGKRQVKDQFIGLVTFKQTHTHTHLHAYVKKLQEGNRSCVYHTNSGQFWRRERC